MTQFFHFKTDLIFFRDGSNLKVLVNDGTSIKPHNIFFSIERANSLKLKTAAGVHKLRAKSNTKP